ncbi:MAG: hypothetical protein LBJ90_06925 [Treponema sp.]|jgi:tetratricopeptide (TPR) repeat protein|nr:hypothetical protein [Treponema sp.]
MPLPKLKALFGKPRRLFRFSLGGASEAGFLRATFFSGLILFFVLGAALVIFSFRAGPAAGRDISGGDVFYRSLREYDRALEQTAAGKGDFKYQESLLDKMEKNAGGVESLLSVLKRRRHLAQFNPLYIPVYRDAVFRALEAYPYSEPLAALAAAALVRPGAINGETETELRRLIPLLADRRFDSLVLSLHVLLGDLKSPEKAAGVFNEPGAGGLPFAAGLPSRERETIAADLVLLKLLKGESAAAEIRSILADSPSPEFIRLAAEYFYDAGDFSRSAELFSLLSGDEDLSRQADALWLGGYAESARNIWKILAASPGAAAANDPGQILAPGRVLYNLAVTAADKDEEAALLRRLLALPGPPDSGRQFGLIRYSRLFNAPQGIAILESAGNAADRGQSFLQAVLGDPLVDLELLRRRAEIREAGRLAGETWLLLGRHSEDEELYRWAAWYFDLQRNYNESAILLKNAARHGFSGEWLLFHEAIQRIREGGFNEAEEILRSLAAGAAGHAADWPAAANLGRLLEARRSPAGALEYYEKAAAAVSEGGLSQEQDQYKREICSQLQFFISRCLLALGRPQESRRSLEYALDLNPANLKARLELDRIGGY